MYKQNPGRGNLSKTGRGIPVSMVNPIMQRETNKKTKKEVSVRNNQAASDKIVEKAAEEKLKKKIKQATGAGEHARQRSLARGATKGTFFGLEKLFD